jgi:hypothetical protein
VPTNTNLPAHKPEQVVILADLQALFFDLDDMHRPTRNVEWVMEFLKGQGIKRSLDFFSLEKLMSIGSVSTVETNDSQTSIFFQIFAMAKQVMSMKSYFETKASLDFEKIPKFMNWAIGPMTTKV